MKRIMLFLAIGCLISGGASEAAQKAKDDSQSQFSKGIELLKRRSENPEKLVPEALSIFRTLLREDSNDEKSLAAIVHTYTLMGGYNLMSTSEACSKASDFAKQLDEKSNASTRGHFALGRWNMWCQQSISRAIPHFEKASEQKSDFQIESLFALASIHLFRSEQTQSKQILEKIRALGETSDPQFIWFELYFGNYKEVLTQTASLLEKTPTHRNALAYRGRAYLAQGIAEQSKSTKNAGEYFQKAVETLKVAYEASKKPGYNSHAEYLIALAFTQPIEATKEYRNLETLSKEALEKGKTSPVLSYRLAQIASALGFREEAEKHFNESVKQREAFFFWIGIDPVMKQVRENSPSIKEKMQQLGLKG
jgi:hypothetical protein